MTPAELDRITRFFKPRRVLAALRRRSRHAFYNLGYRLAGSLDGYPLPPAHLVDLVIGTREVAWYQLGGLFMQQAISTLLRRNGTPIESFGSVLDFGCGCGRIIRWWAGLRDRCELWGCDYNPLLVEWCQRSLPEIARFRVNHADPPLDFPGSRFDLVYSYSVFTHLAAEKQDAWLRELVRVLKPGGRLLITLHGRRVAWRTGFSAEQLKELEEKGVLVFGEERSGANYCAAYHSYRHMSNLQALGLELVDFLEGGARDSSEQDIYLYRKSEGEVAPSVGG